MKTSALKLAETGGIGGTTARPLNKKIPQFSLIMHNYEF